MSNEADCRTAPATPGLLNIPLRLKEFPRAKPKGTPEGGGVYLTVYPESSPNTDIISF